MSHAHTYRSVEVAGDAPYTITIGPGLLDPAQDANAKRLAHVLRGRHALVVSDSHVAPLYADRVEALLRAAKPQMALARWVMPAGEQEKTLARFGECLDALAALGATRDATVVALGGGVVGDLAGFAAACWMRGIDCVQLPTTLLSMVDSSVGGKTGVDLPQGKNLVGAFHAPRAVIADTATLHTLPNRELRAGLAEVVKYGAIFDPHFLGWLEANTTALLGRDDTAMAEAIARSCEFKADVVARDPYEHGHRALLNFGHTFGHAIEAEQGYAGTGSVALNHGEAVAVGMVLAARLSTALGLASADGTARLEKLLDRFALPTALPSGLDARALVTRMHLDKKANAHGLRFVLWDGPGNARVVAGVAEETVLAVLQSGQDR
jgi:3-dehydroquinate synthase